MKENPINKDTGAITMRQYFAAHAPITFTEAYVQVTNGGNKAASNALIVQALATMRWAYADAMCKMEHVDPNEPVTVGAGSKSKILDS